VFSIEYTLRLWASSANHRYQGVLGHLRFTMRPLSLLDLVVLVPFYIPVHTLGDLRMLRSLRILRLLVLLRFGRFSEAMRLIGQVFSQRRQQLYAVAVAVLLLVLVASSLMYAVENPAQPNVFSSVPASMWWAVVTLTTVGYGDAYPITPLGKVLASVIALLGVGLFALPAGILATGFAEVLQNKA
jgi:voltage-gated potassium channel